MSVHIPRGKTQQPRKGNWLSSSQSALTGPRRRLYSTELVSPVLAQHTASRPERNLRMSVCTATEKEEEWKVSQARKSEETPKRGERVIQGTGLPYSLLALGSLPLCC